MNVRMGINNPGLLKKLIWRIDGTADSAKMEFTSAAGTPWQAELSLHSGTDPQAPRLLVIFRKRTDVGAPQRYTQVPPGYSKVPKEAAQELTEGDLRELLAASVQM
jgi:hypothetical protein